MGKTKSETGSVSKELRLLSPVNLRIERTKNDIVDFSNFVRLGLGGDQVVSRKNNYHSLGSALKVGGAFPDKIILGEASTVVLRSYSRTKSISFMTARANLKISARIHAFCDFLGIPDHYYFISVTDENKIHRIYRLRINLAKNSVDKELFESSDESKNISSHMKGIFEYNQGVHLKILSGTLIEVNSFSDKVTIFLNANDPTNKSVIKNSYDLEYNSTMFGHINGVEFADLDSMISSHTGGFYIIWVKKNQKFMPLKIISQGVKYDSEFETKRVEKRKNFAVLPNNLVALIHEKVLKIYNLKNLEFVQETDWQVKHQIAYLPINKLIVTTFDSNQIEKAWMLENEDNASGKIITPYNIRSRLIYREPNSCHEFYCEEFPDGTLGQLHSELTRCTTGGDWGGGGAVIEPRYGLIRYSLGSNPLRWVDVKGYLLSDCLNMLGWRLINVALGDNDIPELTDCIKKAKNLKLLDLHNTKISFNGLIELYKFLVIYSLKLEILHPKIEKAIAHFQSLQNKEMLILMSEEKNRAESSNISICQQLAITNRKLTDLQESKKCLSEMLSIINNIFSKFSKQFDFLEKIIVDEFNILEKHFNENTSILKQMGEKLLLLQNKIYEKILSLQYQMRDPMDLSGDTEDMVEELKDGYNLLTTKINQILEIEEKSENRVDVINQKLDSLLKITQDNSDYLRKFDCYLESKNSVIKSNSSEIKKRFENERVQQFYSHFLSLLIDFYNNAKDITDGKLKPDQSNVVSALDIAKTVSAMIPIPYVQLAIDWLGTAVLTAHEIIRANEAKQTDQIISRNDLLIDEVAYRISDKYSRQIQELTTEGVQQLASCSIKRMVDYIVYLGGKSIKGKKFSDYSSEEKIAELVFGVIEGNPNNLVNTTVSHAQRKNWTAEGLFKRCGLELENGEKWVRQSKTNNRLKDSMESRPEKYGYRKGSPDEIDRYGFNTKVSTNLEIHNRNHQPLSL